MTTTAHEDQFTTATQTIERVHAPYDPIAILRQNVADLEVALKQQTERAEAAEGELESVREDNHSMMVEINGLREELARLRKQKPVAWCDPVEFKDDPWSFQGFRCRTSNYPTMPLYAAPVPAPAVPAEIIELSKKYAIDTEAYHAAMDALLQSTEVRHD